MDNQQFQQLVTMIYVLIGLVGAIAFVGLGGVIALARGNKDVLRMAFQSADPETQKLIRGWVKEIDEAANVAVEITAEKSATADNQPLLSADPVKPEPAG